MERFDLQGLRQANIHVNNKEDIYTDYMKQNNTHINLCWGEDLVGRNAALIKTWKLASFSVQKASSFPLLLFIVMHLYLTGVHGYARSPPFLLSYISEP